MIRFPVWSLVAASALAVSSPVSANGRWPLPSTEPAAAGVSAERLERAHQLLRGWIDAHQYSGYILLLARDGQVGDWRAYGWQDVAAQTPMRRDSVVRLYSMSKIITSTAILMLLEEEQAAARRSGREIPAGPEGAPGVCRRHRR